MDPPVAKGMHEMGDDFFDQFYDEDRVFGREALCDEDDDEGSDDEDLDDDEELPFSAFQTPTLGIPNLSLGASFSKPDDLMEQEQEQVAILRSSAA